MTLILGLSGSLRAASSNTGLLLLAQRLAPDGVDLRIDQSMAQLPFYNADLDTPETWPAEVRAWRDLVATADGLWISTPEYNGSMTAVLKNAIDWVSRPLGQHLLTGKVISLSASAGGSGGAKVLAYLEGVLTLFGNTVINEPSLSFALGAQRIAADGTTDAEVTQQVAQRLAAVVAAIRAATA